MAWKHQRIRKWNRKAICFSRGSKNAKKRIESYIDEAEKEGAKIILDGRGIKVSGKENGYYVGPTIIDYVSPNMKIAKEEIFGPVLAIIRTKEIDEAIQIIKNSL